MKGSRKFRRMLIAVTVLALLAGSAFAEERIYTSGTFKIPEDRIERTEALPEDETPEAETGEEVIPEAENPDAPETLPGAEDPDAPETLPEGAEPVSGEEGNPDDAVTPAEEENQEPEEPAAAEALPPEERTVYITSTRGEHVTSGEAIYLEAHLVGFGDLPVTYQWQVDRNDGMGWQDVGSNRNYHVFIASEETVLYSWRLLVNVDE